MGLMDHQQLCAEEGGNSRHGDPTVSVGNVPINLAGRISCEQLPLGHTRRSLSLASASRGFSFFVRNRAGWASS